MTMTIRYDQLACGCQYENHQTANVAYVVEETLPSGFVQYELHYEPLDRIIGKTIYWTNTSGATSSTCYIGKQSVQVTDVPEYILNPVDESADLPRWAR